MQDVGQQGRTVLFVSHNMPAITRLCPRAILLDDGTIVQDGRAQDVATSYLSSGLATAATREWLDPDKAPGSDTVRLCSVRVLGEDGQVTTTVDIRDPVAVEMEYEVLKPGHVLLPHFSVHTVEGAFAFVALDQDPQWRGRPRPVGRYRSTGWIPGNLLTEGLMLIGPSMRTVEPDIKHFHERDAVSFHVIDAPGQDTARGDYAGGIPGAVRPKLRWTTSFVPAQEVAPTLASAGR
jgi:lipopolysaccharide transport system ATP-binding protein